MKAAEAIRVLAELAERSPLKGLQEARIVTEALETLAQAVTEKQDNPNN